MSLTKIKSTILRQTDWLTACHDDDDDDDDGGDDDDEGRCMADSPTM